MGDRAASAVFKLSAENRELRQSIEELAIGNAYQADYITELQQRIEELEEARQAALGLYSRAADRNVKLQRQNLKWIRVKVEDLDPVDVMFEDHSPGRGWVTIRCFGEAWSNFWPAVGDQTIKQFFLSAGDDYLANKLSTVPARVIDYDRVGKEAGIDDASVETLLSHEFELQAVYGEAWMMDLPQMENPPFTYLRKIIRAIQSELRE